MLHGCLELLGRSSNALFELVLEGLGHCVAYFWGPGAVYLHPLRSPEVPSTQCLKTVVPKNMPFMVFGTRELGPSGYLKASIRWQRVFLLEGGGWMVLTVRSV